MHILLWEGDYNSFFFENKINAGYMSLVKMKASLYVSPKILVQSQRNFH